MKQIGVLLCLLVIASGLFANDTLLFKVTNTGMAMRSVGGNCIRKVIRTADSGFLALDYLETKLVARGYYNDTGFDVKMYTHYFYNLEKGFVQEIKCYDEMGSITLHAEMNRQGDTIWRQTFKDEMVIAYKTFPEFEAGRTIYFSMQKPAVYPGGSSAWKKYIAANMKYPPEAAAKKLEGQVTVEFTVTKDGKVSKPKVVQSASALFNAEATRLISTSPNWIPAEENGNKINSLQRRTVVFKL